MKMDLYSTIVNKYVFQYYRQFVLRKRPRVTSMILREFSPNRYNFYLFPSTVTFNFTYQSTQYSLALYSETTYVPAHHTHSVFSLDLSPEVTE